MALPYVHLHLENTSSTQDDARSLLGEHDRVVVSTPSQTGGRGRRGRGWVTASRALAVSVGWRPGWPRDTWPRMALVAGLAARDALGALFPNLLVGEDGRIGIGLKWPNDLMVAAGKVGGILSEADEDRLIVGLGINLHWNERVRRPPDAVGVLDADPGAGVIEPLAAAFADSLFERTHASPESWGREEYLDCSVTVGSWVQWEPNGRGKAVDIGPRGELVIDTIGGRVLVESGEVWHVRAATQEQCRPDPSAEGT